MGTGQSVGAAGSRTPHHVVNPPSMGPATGFAHALVAAPGRVVYLGGQTAQLPDGSITGRSIVEQFDRAASNLAAVLDACGAGPEHLTTLTVYTTDVPAYRASLREIGLAYRRYLGRHYPAMALFGVTELFDPAALVELVAVAVVPE